MNSQAQDQSGLASVAEAALRASEAKLRRITESGIVGVFYWTMTGAITEANDAFLQMIGRDHADIETGELDWRDLTPPEWIEEDERRAAEVLNRGSGGPWEKEFYIRDGSRLPVFISSAVLDETRATGVAVVLDITELKRVYAAERRARADAERANTAKTEFLSSMSHDLRAPLNAVGGYAQLVFDGLYGPTTEKQRDGMLRIMRAQQHLLAVIRDILDFARVEAGHVRLDITNVPLNDVLQGVGVMIEPQMAAKGLTYECKVGEENAVMRTDRERAVQILLNLLTNALKFTDAGSVNVDCSANKLRVSINVRDTGRGIPADRVAQIFEPFVQVGRNPDEARQGIGLGLAISRQLARNMDGDLRVESTDGLGSVFTLELPRATG